MVQLPHPGGKPMLALLLVTTLLSPAPAAAGKDAPTGVEGRVDLKVLARFPANLGGHEQHTVVRSADELSKLKGGKSTELEAQLAKQLKVERIDWDKQMLLVIVGGTQRTGGYGVELTGLEVKDKDLVVNWKLDT